MKIEKIGKEEYLRRLKMGTSKYRNVKTIYRGICYASKKEAGFAVDLDLRQKAGEIKHWQRQYRIPITVNGSVICTYVVDFRVLYTNGLEELVEVKGFETPEFKLKRKLIEATYLKQHRAVKYTLLK